MADIPKFLFADSVETGLGWGVESGVVYQEKFDGCRALLEFGNLRGRAKHYNAPGPIPSALADCVLDGELVGKHFHVWDVVYANGREVSRFPLHRRQAILSELSAHFPNWMHLVQNFADGGELLKAVLARGGEGIVRKELHTTWGHGWVKCKRAQTEDCVVIARNYASIEVAQYQGGKLVSVGKVQTTREVSVGDVVEVECHSRHESGKLREARLVRVRDDKPATDCTFTTR